MKNILIGLVLIVVLGAGYLLFSNQSSNEKPTDTVVDPVDPVEQVTVDSGNNDLISVTTPQPEQEVSSPIQVSGQARGYWFFEATAPVTVTNWDGLILGEGYMEAQGDWMTEEFVPFTGEIVYEPELNAYSATGTIIFRRANPSGLPENDDAFEMQVQLVDN
jgi:hypothetical protein